MSLDQLRYFIAVAETGSTQAAARAVNISQPPLSRQVRALEDELGTALFVRTGRGMVLRPAGEVFLEHARRIMRAVDEARRDVVEHASAVGREERAEMPPRNSCVGER